MAQSYVLILTPAAQTGFPAIVGGYETHEAAKKAGEAALRWPPNVTDEDYAAFHEAAARNGQSSSRPTGHPAAWLDYTVIPGAANTPPVRETLRAK